MDKKYSLNQNENSKKDERKLSLIIESENEDNQNDDNENKVNENSNNLNNYLFDKKKNSNDSVGSNKSNKQKDWISFLSNNILNGTFGILLFNGVFSLIFSLYFLLHNQGEENNSFFNDNLILIPILMIPTYIKFSINIILYSFI